VVFTAALCCEWIQSWHLTHRHTEREARERVNTELVEQGYNGNILQTSCLKTALSVGESMHSLLGVVQDFRQG
jgi:hypothetical protein